jgi:hypothetical protein
MHTQRSTDDPMDLLSWGAAANTALGTLLFMLFPFALPLLILTAAFLAPLLILGLVALPPIAIIYGVWLVIRKIGRRAAAGRVAVRTRSGEGGIRTHEAV